MGTFFDCVCIHTHVCEAVETKAILGGLVWLHMSKWSEEMNGMVKKWGKSGHFFFIETSIKIL